MAQMKQRFPDDVDYVVSLDQTAAVREGMKEIILTLVIAIALVILVVYLFLQDWRATLIPLLAVPVSLVGTFILFPIFGFSINTLSMFGLVLAIGLVVDDAIVVVEGVQRHIEEGLPPKEAARKAMEELTGPVIGIALVLSAVFVPTVFIPGITGQAVQAICHHDRDLGDPLGVQRSHVKSSLAGLLLRPKKESHGPLAAVLRLVQPKIRAATKGYVRASGMVVRKGAFALVAAGAVRRGRNVLRSPAALPASSPTKIRATCTSTCSFPMPLRWSGHTRLERGGKDSWDHAGHRLFHQRHWFQPAQFHPDQLHRFLFRQSEALGRTQNQPNNYQAIGRD